jgi:hypothetical protein
MEDGAKKKGPEEGPLYLLHLSVLKTPGNDAMGWVIR